uniref:Uncharacterized protein n=1 Tax=Sphaerodactylus townsendi TaxID=933632 RepID=A0ACB8FL18_9SAUR
MSRALCDEEEEAGDAALRCGPGRAARLGAWHFLAPILWIVIPGTHLTCKEIPQSCVDVFQIRRGGEASLSKWRERIFFSSQADVGEEYSRPGFRSSEKMPPLGSQEVSTDRLVSSILRPQPSLSSRLPQPSAMGEKSDYQRLASGKEEARPKNLAPSCNGFLGALPQRAPAKRIIWRYPDSRSESGVGTEGEE